MKEQIEAGDMGCVWFGKWCTGVQIIHAGCTSFCQDGAVQKAWGFGTKQFKKLLQRTFLKNIFN